MVFALKLVGTLASLLFVVWLLWILCLRDLIPAFLTLIAVLVALFREKLFECYFKAELSITASSGPEFAHEVDGRHPETGQLVEKQFWFGIRVENTGLVSAKNVEVYFRGLNSNVIKDFATYNTIPLIRSWVGNRRVEHLARKVSTRWDVCFLHESLPDIISFHFGKNTPNALMAIRCEPNRVSYFKFEVIAVADNGNLQRSNITIEFKGTYREGFEIRTLGAPTARFAEVQL